MDKKFKGRALWNMPLWNPIISDPNLWAITERNLDYHLSVASTGGDDRLPLITYRPNDLYAGWEFCEHHKHASLSPVSFLAGLTLPFQAMIILAYDTYGTEWAIAGLMLEQRKFITTLLAYLNACKAPLSQVPTLILCLSNHEYEVKLSEILGNNESSYSGAFCYGPQYNPLAIKTQVRDFLETVAF
jgi:hypothetical protein